MKELNLVVDAGNTRVKYAFFEGRELKFTEYRGEKLAGDLRRQKEAGYRLHVLLSDSGILPEAGRQLLLEAADTFTEAFPGMKVPLRIAYATPETLGFDRVALCIGGRTLYPECPLLVISSGTALTFNYVDANGTFLGGNISPGLGMRFRSLHAYTARLPYVLPASDYGGIGKTTETAIRNGVMEGMLFEVEKYIGRFRAAYPEGQVILTGGNSLYLEKVCGDRVTFSAELGFIGLNEVLLFTKKD